MNLRVLSFIIVPVAAFALTVGYLRWQQNPGAPQAPPPPVAASAAARAIAPPPPVPPSPARAAAETHEPEPQPVDLRTPMNEPAHDPADPAYQDVPALLLVHGRGGSMLATLTNMLDQAIDVTITVSDGRSATRSSGAVSLRAHERRNLASSGIEFRAGDQVTLQSPPYRDRVMRIP